MPAGLHLSMTKKLDRPPQKHAGSPLQPRLLPGACSMAAATAVVLAADQLCVLSASRLQPGLASHRQPHSEAQLGHVARCAPPGLSLDTPRGSAAAPGPGQEQGPTRLSRWPQKKSCPVSLSAAQQWAPAATAATLWLPRSRCCCRSPPQGEPSCCCPSTLRNLHRPRPEVPATFGGSARHRCRMQPAPSCPAAVPPPGHLSTHSSRRPMAAGKVPTKGPHRTRPVLAWRRQCSCSHSFCLAALITARLAAPTCRLSTPGGRPSAPHACAQLLRC